MTALKLFLLLIFSAAVAFFFWVLAHSTVALECRKLGSFYVGETTYKCSPKVALKEGE